jgi:hypothetical protein
VFRHDFRVFWFRASLLAVLLLVSVTVIAAAAAPQPSSSSTSSVVNYNKWPVALAGAYGSGPLAGAPARAAIQPVASEAPASYQLPAAVFNVTGPQKIIVLHTRFSDYTTATRYTQGQVQGFFDTEINKMWGNISYGNISINATVSNLVDLPHPRSNYITDHGDGDLSEGAQFMNVLNDAVAAAHTAGIDFTGAKDVMVVMGETDAAQYHRGQATTCMLPVGPSNSLVSVGCAIFSENPADPNERVWGRWMHEMGHAFQAPGGPAHPSNYNNSFELMDRLYPGHSGMFSKQASGAGGFPGWIAPASYDVVPTSIPGTTDTLYAEEYQPSDLPAGGKRAIKFYASASVYFIISVRQRMNGDEIRPIPDDHGVLIERVQPGADPWVTVIGPGGDATQLWQPNPNLTIPVGDGVFVTIVNQPDPLTWAYTVSVRRDAVPRPDVMIRPWLTPPLNTWETSDIWVDSSCNGYGSFMYGTSTPSGDTTPLGYGNGDSPCANHENHVFARIRNIGNTPAANVVVHFQVTDPLGVGMNSSTWVDIGTATSATFPGLASLSANSYTDVFVPWTPAVTLTPEQMSAGLFNFHSCIRVIIDTVAGETIVSNQDGIDEQENFGQFFTPPAGATSPAATIDYLVPLRNDDGLKPKSFNLDWEQDMPAGWKVVVNGNDPTVNIPAGGLAMVPVSIMRTVPAAAGEVYSLTLRATYLHPLPSDLPGIDPFNKLPDIHIEYKPLSAATLGVIVADPTKISVKPQRDPNGGVCVFGHIAPLPPAPPTGGQGTQLEVDLMGGKHDLMATKPAFPDGLGDFQVCWASTEIRDLALARFASALYQGQADLPSRTGPGRTQNLGRLPAAGAFQAPAYDEGLIAVSWSYLPLIFRQP